MSLVIQKAQPADAAAMADIHCRSWDAAYAGLLAAEVIAAKNAERPALWRRILSGPNGNHIALWEGVPAGLIGLFSPCRDTDLPEAGEIGGLYLLPEFWGMGIGERLLAFGVETLRGYGHDVFALWVLEGNMRARRFYEKCGFAFDGTRKAALLGVTVMELRYRRMAE